MRFGILAVSIGLLCGCSQQPYYLDCYPNPKSEKNLSKEEKLALEDAKTRTWKGCHETIWQCAYSVAPSKDGKNIVVGMDTATPNEEAKSCVSAPGMGAFYLYDLDGRFVRRLLSL
ncbi:hypothetical protein FNZ56_00995 [Pseudoluteimonas lycopersici]|uniref:Lipoprotein n=1 Tax=Pseudoluteimonas lycopersici TaxID=1324796 RepID=A0A516V203_9GAMM|nr:hypothetical protein [Lysobacter lycopersici]QDQ72559.1 hypothetical protein FNZ56_00995 [Lysobacter lycopersici]